VLQVTVVAVVDDEGSAGSSCLHGLVVIVDVSAAVTGLLFACGLVSGMIGVIMRMVCFGVGLIECIGCVCGCTCLLMSASLYDLTCCCEDILLSCCVLNVIETTTDCALYVVFNERSSDEGGMCK